MMKRKPTGRALSLPMGVTFGVGISLVMTLGISAIIAKLVDTETLPWEKVGYGVMVLLLASSYAGAMTAYGGVKRQRMMVSFLTGGGYFAALLMITALFFGGQYEAVSATAAMVFAGCGLAGLPAVKGKKRRRGGKVQMRTR